MLQLLFRGELTLLQSTIGGVDAGESQAVTTVAVDQSWDASRSFARTSSRSVVRSTHRRCFPYSPPAVGFGLLRWSVARCNHYVVQLSCLFEPHVGRQFLLPYFAPLAKVFSQGKYYVGGPRKVQICCSCLLTNTLIMCFRLIIFVINCYHGLSMALALQFAYSL
jgi:hypothetical protein